MSHQGVENISKLIADGARLYLWGQSKIVFVVVGLLWMVFWNINNASGVGFVVGAISVWLVGQIAIRNSTSSNARVVYASQESLSSAVKEAIVSGYRTGIFVYWLAGMIVMATLKISGGAWVECVLGVCGGVSVVSLLTRLGGGIFTKGADMGADLAGKLENGLPEDDMRNPAVLADNIGDNVGDCAGIATDVFESIVFASSLAYGFLFITLDKSIATPFLLVLFGSSMFASLVGVWYIFKSANRVHSTSDMIRITGQGSMISTFITCGCLLITQACYIQLLADNALDRDTCCIAKELLRCVAAGVALSSFSSIWAAIYGDPEHNQVKRIVEASNYGAGANVVEGLAVGMNFVCVLLISVVCCLGYLLYASAVLPAYNKIIFVALGMLSQACFTLSVDGYGAIVDNAGGIAEVNELEEVRKQTDVLDAAGNALKGVTKTYLAMTSLLTALAAIFYFIQVSDRYHLIPVSDIYTHLMWLIVGIFCGAAVVYGFTGSVLRSVRRVSASVVSDIRNQFAEKPGILTGEEEADYKRTIELLIRESLNCIVYPIIVMFGCIVLAFGCAEQARFGFVVLLGVIIGMVIVGASLSLLMICAGGAWDNSKKSIEASGKKGSDIHSAAVVGDIVGDPFKDTSGPSLRPLIMIVCVFAACLIWLYVPQPAVIECVAPAYISI